MTKRDNTSIPVAITSPGFFCRCLHLQRWCHLSSPPLSWQKSLRWPALLWRDTRGLVHPLNEVAVHQPKGFHDAGWGHALAALKLCFHYRTKRISVTWTMFMNWKLLSLLVGIGVFHGFSHLELSAPPPLSSWGLAQHWKSLLSDFPELLFLTFARWC